MVYESEGESCLSSCVWRGVCFCETDASVPCSRHTGRRRYFIGSAAWRRVFALCGNEGRLRRHLRVLFRGWGGHFAVPEMRASVHGTELSVQGASEVEIYSMNGSLLFKKTVSPAGVSISLDGLNAELCIVKITGGDPGADAADCRLLTTAAQPFKLFV
jgi:hypothetical protein